MTRNGSHALGLVLFVLLSAGVPAAQEGKLDEVRGEVRQDEDDGDGEEPDEGYGFAALCGDAFDGLFTGVVELPFHVPRLILADEGFGPASFADYPGKGEDGYWRPVAKPGEGRSLSLRPRVELGRDFDDLERTAFGLDLDHSSRLGLSLEWARWREDLAAGGSDSLDLGTFDVVYRFAQSRSAAFYAGMGLNLLDDELDTDYGIDLTYGGTFLASPWIFALDSNLGTLGSATLKHLGGSVGLQLERFEIYAGLDTWDIGAASLHSLSLGLRGWF